MPCYADQSLSSDKSCHRVTLFLTQIPLLMKISYINVNFLHKSGVFSELLQCLQFHKITSFKKVNMPKRNTWGWHSGLLQSFLGGIPWAPVGFITFLPRTRCCPIYTYIQSTQSQYHDWFSMSLCFHHYSIPW